MTLGRSNGLHQSFLWIGKKLVEGTEYNIPAFLEGILDIIKLYAWLCFQRYIPVLVGVFKCTKMHLLGYIYIIP